MSPVVVCHDYTKCTSREQVVTEVDVERVDATLAELASENKTSTGIWSQRMRHIGRGKFTFHLPLKRTQKVPGHLVFTVRTGTKEDRFKILVSYKSPDHSSTPFIINIKVHISQKNRILYKNLISHSFLL